MGDSVLSKFDLSGKVAIVTGVGPGMGRDFALALAEAGADVCVSARSTTVIDDVAQEIRTMGRRAIAVPADATDSRQIDELVERAVAELGRLDVMCNHAGSGSPRLTLTELTDDDWDAALRLTLSSVFYGTRAAARVMIARGAGGSIINTSSITSTGVIPGGLLAYSTAKAALNHFTRYTAMELAPHGIRVNAVIAGVFDGPKMPPDVVEWLATCTPMGRWSRADEVSPALLFIASDASSYTTGETLRVSGGSFLTG